MTCSTIVIDGVEDADMMVSVTERPKLVTSQANYETEYVDGRDGSLNRLEYLKDVEQDIEFNILEDFNVKSQIRFVKYWLFNAKKYYFKDDFVYRKIKRVEIGDIENSIAEYGKFEVKFICDPFEYKLGEDDVTIVNEGMILNRGTYKSLPKLEILGSGKGTISINDSTIQLNLAYENVCIDSEVQEIYKDDKNLGLSMIGEFPELKVGQNDIKIEGDFDAVKFNVRERYL